MRLCLLAVLAGLAALVGCSSGRQTVVENHTDIVPVPAVIDTLRVDSGAVFIPLVLPVQDDSSVSASQVVGGDTVASVHYYPASGHVIVRVKPNPVAYTHADTSTPVVEVVHNPTVAQKVNWFLIGVGVFGLMLVIGLLVYKLPIR